MRTNAGEQIAAKEEEKEEEEERLENSDQAGRQTDRCSRQEG